MSQIKTKYIAADAVNSSKLRLTNNTYVRINDSSGTAINVLGVDTSNNTVLQSESTSGNSPNTNIFTGNSSAGNSGNIVLGPGTATGTVGTIDLKGVMNLYGSNTSSTLSGSIETNVSGNDTDVLIRSSRKGNTTLGIKLVTNNDAVADAVATKPIYITTGVKSAGTGNTGDIHLETGTSAGGTRGSIKLFSSLVDLNGTGRITGVLTPTGASDAATKNYIDTHVNLPIWQKFTFTASSFSTAATTNSINLYLLPGQAMLHKVVIKHTQAFSGTGITAYTVSVGISGNLTKHASPFDVTSIVSATNFQSSVSDVIESFGGAVQLLVTATSTGANLSAATTGSVTVWVQSSTLV